MAKSCFLASSGAVLLLGVSLLAACSSGASAPLPPGDGNLAGGGPAPASGDTPPPASTSSPAPTSSTPSPPPSSTGAPPVADAGSGSTDAGTAGAVDTGLGYFIDTGTGAAQPTGALGSCTNPACATDGNECGCQATDSSGNTVQIGCQAGGQCVCVLNGNADTNPFDENGACGTSQATAQQFLQYCTCQ